MHPSAMAREVRRLGLRARRSVADILAGEYRSVFRGQGLVFEEVRPYQPGDDIRAIDWHVTARMGQPFIKRFAEERELTVVLAIDCSASLTFGTAGRRKRDIAGELAAVIAFAAIMNNDRVALARFTEEVECFTPPGKGMQHGLRIIRDALYWRPTRRGTSLAACTTYLEKVFRRRALIALFSDFLDVGYEAPLRRLARRHEVILFRVSDPAENDPLGGTILFEDLESGRTVLANPKSKSGGIPAVGSFVSLSKFAAASGMDLVEASTKGGHLEALIRFFQRRARQLR